MKKQKVFAALLVLALVLSACGKKTEDVNKTIVHQQGETVVSQTPDQSDTAEAEASKSDQAPDEKTYDGAESQPKATPTPVADKSDDSQPGEDSGIMPEGGESGGDTTSVEKLLEDDAYQKQMEAERQEAWKSSFLVWVPEFTDGAFSGTAAADTFDYAYFNLVGGAERVLAYIKVLTAAGFDQDIDTGVREDRIWYYASNADAWTVLVDYEAEADALRVGSGFFDAEEEANEEQVDRLWASSMLLYLPVFMEGKLENHFDDSSDGMFSYAVFSGVTIEDARAYVNTLMDYCFIYDVEAGDTDGTVWYIAVSEDNVVCDFQFSDGICKIGGGIYND